MPARDLDNSNDSTLESTNAELAELLARVRRVEWVARRAVDASTSGGWHSRFRGRGMSFSESRIYQAGDDPRSVDWLATARQGELYVKQFVEERELHLLLCLDVSASMRSGALQRRAVAAEAGAVLALSALQNHDRVGLLCFGQQIERWVKPQTGKGHVLRLVRDMLVTKASTAQPGTNLALALRTAMQVQKKKSVIVIATDLLGSAWPQRELRLARQKHDVVVLHIEDPSDVQLPNVGLARLACPETNVRRLIDTSDEKVRHAYAKAAADQLQPRLQFLRSIGVDRIPISTSSPDPSAPIVRYLRTAKAA
jgi:uncharacterized protein (DUF58 family)